MTATREIDIARKESRTPSVLDQVDTWFEEMWKDPLSFLRRPLFQELAVGGYEHMLPSVDVFEEGGDLVFKADLPGLAKGDITVEVGDGVLTLAGEKKRAETLNRDKYYRFERSHGRFSRRFRLPDGADTSKVTARYESGVLEVRIPKPGPEMHSARKIEIS